MSIDESLQLAVDRKDLFYLPMDVSDPVERRLYLTKDVKGLLEGTTEAQRTRAAPLKANMETFVKGEMISLCFTPYKAGKSTYFGLLDPPGDATWDLRAVTPSPSLRILGMFADVDVFVALDWWPKRIKVPWSNKDPLGDDKLQWRLAIHECRDKWHNILAGLVPVAGTEVRKYVSRNFDLNPG